MEKETAKNKELEAVRVQVSQMYENGQIKQAVDGTFQAVTNPLEQEQIKSKRKTDQQQQQMPA